MCLYDQMVIQSSQRAPSARPELEPQCAVSARCPCMFVFSLTEVYFLGFSWGNTQSVKRPGRSAGLESQEQSGIEKKTHIFVYIRFL